MGKKESDSIVLADHLGSTCMGEMCMFSLAPQHNVLTSSLPSVLQEGLSRSRFLVVGCADSNVRVLGLDPEDGLRNLAIQAVPSMPFSALFLFRYENHPEPSMLTTLTCQTHYKLITSPLRHCQCRCGRRRARGWCFGGWGSLPSCRIAEWGANENRSRQGHGTGVQLVCICAWP